jgi:hypothetical protein
MGKNWRSNEALKKICGGVAVLCFCFFLIPGHRALGCASFFVFHFCFFFLFFVDFDFFPKSIVDGRCKAANGVYTTRSPP